jgi:predicted amidohydrolase
MKQYVRVAAIQARPQSETFDDLMDGADVPHALELLDRATSEEVDIVCFPELYPMRGEAELRRKARQAGVFVVCGIREEEVGQARPGDVCAYNTATLIDPDGGIVGRQRKVFPTAFEVAGGIVPGEGYRVFRTPLGNIGMIVCADLPFSRRGIVELKRGGADIVFNPSWWFALGEAYPASVIGRHLEYGLPIFGVDIARYALSRRGESHSPAESLSPEDDVRIIFPSAGGYTTATITPPCRTVEELGDWFRTKPGGINAMSDFVMTLGEDEDILRATVDIEAVRQFPGYYFSEQAAAVTAADLTPV